jgi:hypothetical protein
MKIKRRNAVSHILISFVICYFLILAGAGWLEGQDFKSDPALKALLPSFPDWAFQEEPASYFPGTLFEYIDGASEAYLGYDFKELLVAQYLKTGTEAVVTLEIYDMGTPLNAFGIFSSERYPDNPEAGIGSAGYLEEEVLNFISGRYYVKLLCYNGEENTAAYLKQFALAVESKIKDKSSLPDIFRFFPEEARMKNSEKFIKKNFMGFDFLRNGYAVTYRKNQVEFEAYIIEADSATEAQAILQKILDFYSGEKVPFIKEGDKYHQTNIYGQHVFLGQVKNYLFGLSRIPQDQIPLALSDFNRLRQALESRK